VASNTFDTSDPTYRDLLARVVQPGSRVVPFVGAGLNSYGDASQRLPLWRELLDRLVAEGKRLGLIPEAGDPTIDTALASGHLIEAMDRIIHALGEPTFRRAVEMALDDRSRPIPPAVTELVAISWSLIVTTNLDRFVSRAYLERYGRPIQAVTNMDSHRLTAALAGTLTSADTMLAQIHGDIDTYPSWRLTRSHYQQLLRDPGYVEALKQLFLRQIFFVGFGLQDDDFDFLLETVANIYPAGVGEFFALIARSRRDDAIITRLIRTNGLRPIFYDVDPDPAPDDPYNGHRQVHECLAHLALTWARSRTSLAVTLKYFPELDPFIVGRDDEIAALTDMLVAAPGAVVQVVGLGGSGKTSLVQQLVHGKAYELATAGFSQVFGCSFYRANVGQFIRDLVLTLVGPVAASLPAQVKEVAAHLRRHRTLLVLDGAEAVIDRERRLGNPYLAEIVEATLAGGGAIVVTSRVPVRGGWFQHASILDVAQLGLSDVRDFLSNWGLGHLDAALTRRLREVTAGHPIALRILAGVLRDVPVKDIASTVERSAVVDVADEVDPLEENRLARILGSYVHHLDDAQLAFLTCFTAFSGPTPYQLVDAALTRPYPTKAANRILVGEDLRPIVSELLDRRLLIASTAGELTDHPTVRDYFARRAKAEGASLMPIHRFLMDAALAGAPDLPATFDEAIPIVRAARHAAACHDWMLFDDLFKRRLMRDFRNHMCNNLGAWEETLGLARIAAERPDRGDGTPAYYPVTVARCLKHLGRSDESRESYVSALRLAAASQDPDTAKYVNNLLTLLVWRGELDAADHLLELNIRALSWIEQSWKYRWQVEHGFSTFAYLRLLQGDLSAAEQLFEVSRTAWEGHDSNRLWIYDYYPLHRSELVLQTDPNGHDAALQVVQDLLDVAETHHWPESICRGHIQAALVLLDRAGRSAKRTDLVDARQRLDAAGSIATGMVVPDVEIAYLLAEVKATLVQHEIDGIGPSVLDGLSSVLDRVAAMIERSGLALAAPEVIAGRGVLNLYAGRHDAALRQHEEALRLCRAAGNELAPRSARSIVGWLGNRLDRRQPSAVPRRFDDLRAMIGTGLSSDWMAERLNTLPPS
jgi:tetratricopeptide (TPR) repeat protein